MKVWDVSDHWVEKFYATSDHAEVTSLVLDETSSKKGHNYTTVAIDVEQRSVVRCEGVRMQKQ